MQVNPVVTELINPGLGERDAGAISQVWRVSFDNGTTGEIRISPSEAVVHKGILKEMLTELAGYVRNSPDLSFPYQTNNLGQELAYLRKPRRESEGLG
jgi:hypothetical protein